MLLEHQSSSCQHFRVHARVTIAILSNNPRKVLRDGLLKKWRLPQPLVIPTVVYKYANTHLLRPNSECFREKAATCGSLVQRQSQRTRKNRPEHFHIEAT